MEVLFDQRAHVVSYLFDLMERFNLVMRTIFLTIQYLDIYIANRSIPSFDLRHVGIAALWMASKYEEVHPLTLKHCCKLVHSTKRAFVNIEADLLSVLDFRLERHTCIDTVEHTQFDLYMYSIACIGTMTSCSSKLEEATGILKAIASKQSLDYTHPSIVSYLALLHLTCDKHQLFESVNVIFRSEWEILCYKMGKCYTQQHKRRREGAS